MMLIRLGMCLCSSQMIVNIWLSHDMAYKRVRCFFMARLVLISDVAQIKLFHSLFYSGSQRKQSKSKSFSCSIL